jgi:hypothetical protein
MGKGASGRADARPVTAPFQTITKARDVVRTVNSNMTGDIYVYLRGGDYRITSPITLEVKDSGAGKYRIYYQGYPGETPVINGAQKVTGWTVSSGGVYKATLDRKTKLRNLYTNDARANMTSKTVSCKGSTGTYAVTSGQAAWAWAGGSGFDGVTYSTSDVPDITTNKDDLEIVNQTTWNENVVCVRDVVSTSGNARSHENEARATGHSHARGDQGHRLGGYSAGNQWPSCPSQPGPQGYFRRIRLFTRAMATLTIDSPAMTPDETGTM